MTSFNKVLWSESEEVHYLTEDLLQLMIEEGLIRYKTVRKKYENVLKNFICNCIQSMMTSREYVTVSLNKNNYNVIPRYNPVGHTYDIFNNTLKWLANSNYIDLYKAPRRSSSDVKSEFIVLDKLRSLINEYEISLSDVTLHRDNEPIKLKRSKKLAEYEDTEQTKKDRVLIKSYQELLNSYKSKICINGFRIRERIKVSQSYTNQLKKHGRIYTGQWQNYSSSERSTITINGADTVEVDIKNCSLRMALQIAGVKAEGDLYEIKDYPRALVKDIINRMLNLGENIVSTVQGIQRTVLALKDKYVEVDRSYLKQACTDCYEYYSEIAEEWFFQSRGLDLQYLDSRVCINVIEEFTKENLVVLTVHDSFIIQKEFEEKLRDSITRNYELIIGDKPILK